MILGISWTSCCWGSIKLYKMRFRRIKSKLIILPGIMDSLQGNSWLDIDINCFAPGPGPSTIHVAESEWAFEYWLNSLAYWHSLTDKKDIKYNVLQVVLFRSNSSVDLFGINCTSMIKWLICLPCHFLPSSTAQQQYDEKLQYSHHYIWDITLQSTHVDSLDFSIGPTSFYSCALYMTCSIESARSEEGLVNHPGCSSGS